MREALHQSRLVEPLTAYDPAFSHTLQQLHLQGLADPATYAAVMHQVTNQAYLLSSLDIFYVSGWLALLMVPLCWLVRRPHRAAAPAAAD